MSQRIKLLDQHCINQIAAGEVVERPLSVVKELIENSLDAHARKIEISVEGGGTSLIKIKDDGDGILPDDLRLAILPHATSKITTIHDLNTLQTLGFRGEALPSIASVSRFSILSRPPEQLSGYEIEVEGGTLISMSEKGCPIGTTVTVRDLFFNTPARQKFLRSNNTEFGLISDMVSRLALASPDVAFALRHPQNLILNTPGKNNLQETIGAVYGNETARKMIPVRFEDSKLMLSGYISSPDLVRSSMNSVTFIVNGRVIRSQFLNQALKDGYYTLIHSGTYPIGVLSLTMPPSDYDVNVHPAKLEIKFKEEKELGSKLVQIIRDTLIADKPLRGSYLVEPKQSPQGIPQAGGTKGNLFRDFRQQETRFAQVTNSDNIASIGINPESNSDKNPGTDRDKNPGTDRDKNPGTDRDNNVEIFIYNDAEINSDKQVKSNGPAMDMLVADRENINNKVYAGNNFESRDSFVAERAKHFVLFEELRSIGQLFQTYILATDERTLYIIDQHAAHERIRYDQLARQIQNGQMSSQLLLIPETMDLTVQEESILLEHFNELHEMGFIIEHFGERTYFLRGIPILQNLDDPGRLFRMFLEEIIANNTVLKPEKLLEEWIFTLACRSAIKAKERLSLPEMDELLQQLGAAMNPFTCPHGRPTIIEMTKQELEKRFKR